MLMNILPTLIIAVNKHRNFKCQKRFGHEEDTQSRSKFPNFAHEYTQACTPHELSEIAI